MVSATGMAGGCADSIHRERKGRMRRLDPPGAEGADAPTRSTASASGGRADSNHRERERRMRRLDPARADDVCADRLHPSRIGGSPTMALRVWVWGLGFSKRWETASGLSVV